MSRRRLTLAAIALLLIAAIAPLGATETLVIAELWVELDPIFRGPTNAPLSRDAAVDLLLDEAQFIASGMVYGYSFSYEPSNPNRGIAEVFSLSPYATVVRGDPRLHIFQTWLDSDRLFARLTYEIDQAQRGWFDAWHGSAIPRSTGTGSAPLFAGQPAKIDAIRDGVRAAVKAHVQQAEFNRPLRITGAVLLAETPRVIISRGDYEATVQVYLQVDEIRRYDSY